MTKKTAKKDHETSHEKCSCKEEISKLNATIEDLTSTLKHVQAEYQNYIKRVQKEKADLIKYAGANMVKEFLPIVDNLDRAIANSQSQKEFLEGIKMIRSQIQKCFADNNVQRIEAIGEKFNPRLHEAMMVEESDKEPGTVTEVFEDGYIMDDRVIRHAKVKVSKAKQDSKENKKSEEE